MGQSSNLVPEEEWVVVVENCDCTPRIGHHHSLVILRDGSLVSLKYSDRDQTLSMRLRPWIDVDAKY